MLVARSSMEVMLDSLRQRDERPKDSIPRLPARPVSRGRLPSSASSSSRRFNNKGGSFPLFGEEIILMVEQPDEESRLSGLTGFPSCHKTTSEESDGPEAQFENKLDYAVAKDAVKDEAHVQPTDLEEFQRRVVEVEAAVRQKEEENLSLKQMLQQYKSRWSEYEVKMKSMEEKWQNQLTSLQMSLAATKKSLAADDILGLPGRLGPSPNGHYFETRNTSVEFQTPESTLAKPPHDFGARLSRDTNGMRNPVRKEEAAKFPIEVKSGQLTPGTNTDEELQKLKSRFTIWKKDFKVKLQETKVSLQKIDDSESGKSRKKWCIMRSKK
ncbi:myosin-2-like [Iris pallida]|uniref:Myosin-2-like n=1 Tax=Iris pallida TaxID=29817 RepID=A0AAX6H0N0_IRIPA|nr:myosin-2-like [Iris pallida]KAJ6834352.1 myosin-2-like [Iris pallida]